MLPSRAHAAALGVVLAVALAVGLAHGGHHRSRPVVRPAADTTAATVRTVQVPPRPVARVASRSHSRVAIRHRHRVSHRHRVERRVRRVLRVARSLRGHPYVWGAAGPRAFDCSGYVQFVFRRALGRHLPKYTDTQYARLRHIGRGALRPGDLVFVGSRHHHKWHVGIYAGHGRWWDAPHTGSHVQKQRIWGAAHSFARVIRR